MLILLIRIQKGMKAIFIITKKNAVNAGGRPSDTYKFTLFHMYKIVNVIIKIKI